MNGKTTIILILKGLILSYGITGMILAFLAFGIWKWEFSDFAVNIGMIASYILAALFGGFYLGKKKKEKKFIWGILLGVCYIIILFVAALCLDGSLVILNRNTITTAFICILSGMLGGMLG
ncbi:MAG: TIGR04086 family membrane protein [Lachnospiraceae bacterium]|nr:TIGR04086 family membrane protein [Lachnospiraceae bacterium]